MGEALYRKYRPKSLNDVVGQPHITQTLENALKQGRINHGYLFSGPRGVGKTSIARILAHQINNFEYGDPNGALDIIEIDAASNRRIDEIRELRDKVHNTPISGEYKIYIIDEVHMLTREAFNALLKTLEEPPKHAIFILATTEAHKLPDTIISRTQRFAFKPVAKQDVISHLSTIAKKEAVTISDEALSLIAQHGEGSFRDSISLLDQLSTKKNIILEHVSELLGIPPNEVIESIISCLQAGSIHELLEILEQADAHGFHATLIAKALSSNLRESLIKDTPVLGKKTLQLMEKLLVTASFSSPRDYLELILLDIALENTDAKPSAKTNAPAPKSPPIESSTTIDKEKHTSKNESHEKKASKIASIKIDSSQLQEKLDNGMWDEVLAALKKKYNTLYGVARMATPVIEDNTLVLHVPFAFHNKRLSEEKNSAIVSATLAEIAGGYVAYTTRIDNTKQDKPQITSKDTSKIDDSATLQTVTEIFGGGEVLEQ